MYFRSLQIVSWLLSLAFLACSGPGAGYFSDSVSANSDRSRVSDSSFTDELSTADDDRSQNPNDGPGIDDYQESPGSVLAPQMITGSYLVKCEPSAGDDNTVICQVENRSEFTDATSLDHADIRLSLIHI